MNDILSEPDSKAVNKILMEALGVEQAQLTKEARLSEDLAADSLTLVEIHMALEDRFNLAIPDERLDQIKTVEDIFDLIAELLQSPRRHS